MQLQLFLLHFLFTIENKDRDPFRVVFIAILYKPPNIALLLPLASLFLYRSIYFIFNFFQHYVVGSCVTIYSFLDTLVIFLCTYLLAYNHIEKCYYIFYYV